MERILTCTLLSILAVPPLLAIDTTVSVDLVNVNRTGGTPVSLVHVTGRKEHSSTHLLWGAADNLFPTFLLVQSSDPKDDVEVDVSQPDPVLRLNHETESYGLIFLKLVEYNDSKDEVDFSKLSKNIDYTYLNKLNWKSLTTVSPHTLGGDEVLVTEFVGERSPRGSGAVHLKFMASASRQRASESPRLIFLPGVSVQVECSLVGLNTSYSAGRFGIQLVVVSSRGLGVSEDFEEEVANSLDDEFTPGNFKTINLKLAKPVNTSQNLAVGSPVAEAEPQPPSGFLQLRPVSYVSPDSREVKSSRNLIFEARRSLLTPQEAAVTKDSPGFWFYGSRLSPDQVVGVRLQNVSLGSEQDGFYASSHYMVWTLSMGTGLPPQDNFSTQLVVLLVFAMILAVAAIFVGTGVVLVLRRRYPRTDFQPLVNSDDGEEEETRSIA